MWHQRNANTTRAYLNNIMFVHGVANIKVFIIMRTFQVFKNIDLVFPHALSWIP